MIAEATKDASVRAKSIAENADADIFEISPVNPYSNDDLNWTNNNRLCNRRIKSSKEVES